MTPDHLTLVSEKRLRELLGEITTLKARIAELEGERDTARTRLERAKLVIEEFHAKRAADRAKIMGDG